MQVFEYIIIFLMILAAISIRDVFLYLWNNKKISHKKLTAVGIGLSTILAGSGVILSAPPASADNWYVSWDSGSDSSGTGSFGNPWKTISKAVNNSDAGDTIYAREGTYNEWIRMKASGSAGSPITIRNYNNELVVIDGTGVAGVDVYTGLIHLYEHSYLSFYNLILQDSPGRGISTDYSDSTSPIHHIIIYNCTFQNWDNGRALFIYTSRNDAKSHYIHDITVSHCTFDAVGYDGGDPKSSENILFHVIDHLIFEYNTMLPNCSPHNYIEMHCCENVTFDHNDIDAGTTIPSSCMMVYFNDWYYLEGDSGEVEYGFSKNIRVSNNTLSATGQCLAIGAEGGTDVSYCDNIIIENNIIKSNTYSAFLIAGYDSSPSVNVYPGVYDVTIKFNTFYTPSGRSMYFNEHILYENLDNLVIANNIFYATSSTTYYILSWNMDWGSEIPIVNNVFYKSGGSATTYFHGTTGYYGTGSQTGNPLFISLGSNFDIQAGSSARNTGSASYPSTYDCNGTTRPQEEQYDIGAYEYSSWTNTAPSFSSPSPANASVSVALTPATTIAITDPDVNQTLTVCFYYSMTSITGPWTLAQKNTTSPTRTSPYTYRDMVASYASGSNTLYYWKVTANDGMINKSAAYYFTTIVIYDYETTINTNGVDYSVWLGGNTTAYYVMKNISGLNEASESVSLLSNAGSWSSFTGTKTGTNFTVHTFDVVKTVMDDSAGTTVLYMVKNPSINYAAYAAARTVTLTKIGNGYNYTGYTKTVPTTVSSINTTLALPVGYMSGVWDKSTYKWNFWISGFSIDDYDVNQYEAVVTKIAGTTVWVM